MRYHGQKIVKGLYHGDTRIKAMYKGDELIWRQDWIDATIRDALGDRFDF